MLTLELKGKLEMSDEIDVILPSTSKLPTTKTACKLSAWMYEKM
jgi:hypothetical protein